MRTDQGERVHSNGSIEGSKESLKLVIVCDLILEKYVGSIYINRIVYHDFMKHDGLPIDDTYATGCHEYIQHNQTDQQVEKAAEKKRPETNGPFGCQTGYFGFFY